MIDKLYTEYFQKSKVFLYPLLEIPKMDKIDIVTSYVAWENKIRQEDCKLLVLYNNADKDTFLKYKAKYVLNNKYFLKEYINSENQCLCIFDLKSFEKDWIMFLKGNYSKLSNLLKDKISKHYGEKSKEYEYIESYLYPKEFFKEYSMLLDINEDNLIDVGELCDKYDINKEFLKFKPLTAKYIKKQ